MLLYVIILDLIFILNFIIYLFFQEKMTSPPRILERDTAVLVSFLRPPGGVSRTVNSGLQIKSCSSERLVLCHQKHLSMLEITPEKSF